MCVSLAGQGETRMASQEIVMQNSNQLEKKTSVVSWLFSDSIVPSGAENYFRNNLAMIGFSALVIVEVPLAILFVLFELR